jgi:hypothetical protein
MILSSLATISNGFLYPTASRQRWLGRDLVSNRCRSAFDENAENGGPNTSRLLGNNRKPTAAEIQVMDEMITKLSNAKPYELPNAVRRAMRVISTPQFFLRIAERVDMARVWADPVEQEKLSALATNLVSTLEAIVSTAEDRLEERAKEVEEVVKAAAEPESGEFLVPLLPERSEAMRSKLEGLDPSSLDEGFLATVDAWVNKSYQDGMHLMVGILQKVLQTYAGIQISRALKSNDARNSTEAATLMEHLLHNDTEVWEAEIQKLIQGDTAASSLRALKNEVQRTMETVVLGLETGSLAQRVQAEYLRELVSRIDAIENRI